MPARKPIRFDDLPLFASDADLAVAVVGTDPEKRAIWLAQIPLLERSGFPKKTSAFGRYRPAVKDYCDRFYCNNPAASEPSMVKGVEGTWQSGRRSLHPTPTIK